MALDDHFVDVASVPSVFCSALYALVHTARVKKGDCIFIQSRTSGLGLAAIQIATNAGAEIFALVHNNHDKQYVQDNYGLPEVNLVFAPPTDRIDDTIANLKTATRGMKFNVILSSMANNLIHSIGSCLAPRGCFVYVGKLDTQHRHRVGLEMLNRDITFSSFDLDSLLNEDMVFCSGLLEEVGTMLRSNVFRPLSPTHVYPLSTHASPPPAPRERTVWQDGS